MVGLLTFWFVPNCGAFAQAYALQKVVGTILPEKDVFQIAYLHEKHKEFYGINSFVNDEKSRRNELFAKYYNSIPNYFIKTSNDLSELSLETLVMGSDIIWDFSISAFGNDPYLFGNGITAKNKISYGTSFGTCKSEWKRIPGYVIDGLKAINHISVRDYNSSLIVKNITGNKPVTVLDPVWLWDWNNDKNVTLPEREGYIFLYGGNFGINFKNNLKKYALEHGLEIVAYGGDRDDYSWCDVKLDDSVLSPFEVIGYIKKAEAVATNSFHGITYGLIFGKKIAYNRSTFIDAKIRGLLEELNLYERFIDNDDINNMLLTSWNYKQIEEIISEKRKNSLEFLCNSLVI